MRAFVSVTVAVLVVIGIGIAFVGGLPVPSTKPLIGTALLLTGPQGTVPLAGRPWPKATWRVTASYANPISAIDSVVCPSPHMCQAVAEPFPDPRGAAQDSILLSTTNGGRSWRQDAVSGHWSIGGISCSSSTSCVTSASGSRQDVMLSTHNGGASWHARPLPTTTLPAASVDVACPTATTCHAYFVNVLHHDAPVFESTSDAGASWTQGSFPAKLQGAILTCPTANFCIVAGLGSAAPTHAATSIFVTRDGGDQWSRAVLIPGAAYADAITCPSSTGCVVLSANFYTNELELLSTTDGGITWTERRVTGAAGSARQCRRLR